MTLYDSIDDFVLFPSHETYPDVQGHQNTRHEDLYNGHQYTMDDQFIDLAMTTYDSCAPVAALSSAPATLYNAPQFIVDAPQDNFKYNSYRHTPPRSPSQSATHSFDHPPSTMSSTSGASIQSANSSAVGSPYSRSHHVVASQDHWAETGHGLGIGPSILSQDSFYPGDYVTRSLEHEVIFAQEKLPSDFVGKSPKVSSSQGPVGFASLSSSLSDSFRHTFVPSLAVNTSVSGSDTTIDTILQEVNSQVGTPGVDSSPDSAHPVFIPANLPLARARKASPSTSEVFMSPSTPASATPSRTRSPAVAPRAVSRSQSVMDAGVKKVKSSPRPSPGRIPYGRPTPPPASPTLVSVGHFQTPFFSQSSGNFVAPLESSCWFSYATLCNLFLAYDLVSLTSNVYHPIACTIDRALTQSFTTDPSLIQPFQTPVIHNTTTAPYPGVMHAFHTPTQLFQPPSPAPSNSSVRSQHRPGSASLKARSQSPYHHPSPFQPYPPTSASRRISISSEHSRYSLGSHRSSSFEADDENTEKGRCPKADCGRVFKDLKAHMLTHQLERPEKCPIMTCDYHQKGFARKYDKNRHTLTHYKGTMVCGFCPGSGSAAEKSFNRADVFKRHLTSVHGVEQAPPNSRKRVPNSGASKKLTNYPPDATGKCSTCSDTFSNAQDFYEHLDDCVLRIVRQEEPSEAINAKRLAEVADDPAVQETLDRHMLHSNPDSGTHNSTSVDEEYDQDEDEDDNDHEHEASFVGSTDTHHRSGKGSIKSNKRNTS